MKGWIEGPIVGVGGIEPVGPQRVLQWYRSWGTQR
jgi:hypothetical protein